jgi:hypothetical protein
MEQGPSWKADSRSVSELPRLLWTPKISLPCSQQPATGPYPEPDKSSPHISTHFPKINSNIIRPPMYA